MQQARLKILQNMPVFGGIHTDALEFLLGEARIVSVAKGEFFFREEDPGSSMFVLETGKVSVFKTWEGRDYLLSQLGPGNCFGEMALIDFYPRSASVLAVEDCSALELSTATLHKLYERDLKQFTMIQMNMGREVSRRLRESDKRLFQAKAEAEAIPQDYDVYSV